MGDDGENERGRILAALLHPCISSMREKATEERQRGKKEPSLGKRAIGFALKVLAMLRYADMGPRDIFSDRWVCMHDMLLVDDAAQRECRPCIHVLLE